jgi:hypothetical protein
VYCSIAYDQAVLSAAFFKRNSETESQLHSARRFQDEGYTIFLCSLHASFLSLRHHFATICSQNVLNSEEAENVTFTYALQIDTNGVTVISSEN